MKKGKEKRENKWEITEQNAIFMRKDIFRQNLLRSERCQANKFQIRTKINVNPPKFSTELGSIQTINSPKTKTLQFQQLKRKALLAVMTQKNN